MHLSYSHWLEHEKDEKMKFSMGILNSILKCRGLFLTVRDDLRWKYTSKIILLSQKFLYLLMKNGLENEVKITLFWTMISQLSRHVESWILYFINLFCIYFYQNMFEGAHLSRFWAIKLFSGALWWKSVLKISKRVLSIDLS